MPSKRIFIWLAIVALTACANPANTEKSDARAEDVNLTPLCNQGVYDLCGYIDKKASELYLKQTFILPAKFEKASAFHNGLAAVRDGGLYGYINASGEYAIEPQFTLAGDFDQGLAIIEQDGLLGVIDVTGKIVVQPQFAEATVHSAEVIIARLPEEKDFKEKVYVINNSSINMITPPLPRKAIVTPYYTDRHPQQDLKISGQRLYNIKTGWVTSEPATFRIFDRDNRDYIWAGDHNDLFGLMKTDGTWQKEPRYGYPRELINNRAVYRKHSSYGAVDSTGETVLSVPILRSDFSDPYAKVHKYSYKETSRGPRKTRKQQQYGLIDHFGNLLGDQYFYEVDTAGRVRKLVREDNRSRFKWFIISPDGTLSPDDKIIRCPSYTLTPIGDGKMDITTPAGEKMFDYEFDDKWGTDRQFNNRGQDIIGALHRACDRPSGVTANGRAGTLLTDGTLVGGRLFDEVLWPGRPRQWVLESGKWGLMDLDGVYHIAPEYEDVKAIGAQYFEAKQGGKTYYFQHIYTTYNRFGSFKRTEKRPDISPPRFYSDSNLPKNKALICPRVGFKNGAKLISENDLWGMVDAYGVTVIPAQHRALSCYEDGIAWAPHEDKRKWCQIDQNGEFDLSRPCHTTFYPMKYKYYHSDKGVFTSLPESFDDDPFESSVLWNKSHLDARNEGDKVGRWIKNQGGQRGNEKVTVPIE